MTGNWQMFPPWTAEQGPTTISPGSQIRDDFEIVKHASEFEIMTSLCWTGLSRQEVANLRNLISSQELRELLLSYNYGLSWGAGVDMESSSDPNDAECDFTIHSKQDIPETTMREIVCFVKDYRVQ